MNELPPLPEQWIVSSGQKVCRVEDVIAYGAACAAAEPAPCPVCANRSWMTRGEIANLIEAAVAAAVAACVAAERESIAAWIEPQRNDVPATGKEFAAAIRARNKP
jgi:hypothetical protein